MKITNSDTAPLSGAAQAASATAGSPAAPTRTTAANKSADYAQLSGLSANLRSYATEGTQARVEDIAATVASGQYQTDSNQISGKIIEQSMRMSAAA
jgi:anti-sigma28 factor (negative regulator of flagellin synthesis)